jgi:hypothetical protein
MDTGNRSSGRHRRLVLASRLLAGILAGTLVLGGQAMAAGPSKSKKSSQSGPKVYKWVDENGVTHYGDQVPPQYANQDRLVLNQHGVVVGRQDGAQSPEEAAAARQTAADKAAAEAARQRDQVLLSTYLSVEEIEALRDRRMDLMDGQIRVTENYLAGLRAKLKELQAEAAPFKPYNDDPAAPPIDDKLAGELADTMDSIALYEKTLQDTREKQAELASSFEADIARFQELHAQGTSTR